MQKKIWAVIVGFGNRGQVYGDYSLQQPDKFGVCGVVDVNEFKLLEAKKRYNLTDDKLYKSLDEFLSKKVKCDFIINSTMDQLHYKTAIKILSNGYNMLMEKPIVPNKKQLLNIKKVAEQNNCKVCVCHVLRYTPFYLTIKKLLKEGAIGEVMSIETNEHVCIAHYITSYVRGKWNSEEKCGSSFLLAKSCHDLDLLCWLNNETIPVEVSSFGDRAQFVKDKKPSVATNYCYQCPLKETCVYSAEVLYEKLNAMPFLTWDRLNKPLDEITASEKEKFLQSDIYGKCVYDINSDIVDRQNIIIKFKNGSIATFSLVGGTTKANRYIHIVGSKGEIEGKLEENKFILRHAGVDTLNGKEEVIEVDKEIIIKARYGGHSGGDYAIMEDMVKYFNGDTSSLSITSLSDSVNGHLCVFGAEQSRRKNKNIKIK